ncbi:GntR family transcriptional regulator [Streptomyces sp. bgisy153]|uniref:GntR family transcriptional regulator n=1 Tax=Streptomyces sp. bgisy153 TaxID=3413793 RepID=UPI003D72FCCB
MASNTVDANGTITRDARSRYRTAQREESGAHGAFEAETKRSGATPRSEVEVSRSAAPAEIAELLGVAAGDEVVVRARRMYVGERLVQLADSYIPGFVAEAAPAVAQLDTGVGGIISRMSEVGLAQDSVVEDVEQRPATAEQAEALGVQSGDQLLTITHTGVTQDGRVVEVTRHTLGPGWKLRFEVPLA